MILMRNRCFGSNKMNAQLLCSCCHGKKTKLERLELEAVKRDAIQKAQNASDGGVKRSRKLTQEERDVRLFVDNEFLSFACLSPPPRTPPTPHVRPTPPPSQPTQTKAAKHQAASVKPIARSTDIRVFLQTRAFAADVSRRC